MKYRHFLAILLAAGLVTSVSVAESEPEDHPVKIENKAQAERPGEGTKVAFACESCRTFQPSVIDKKSFLSFFNKNDTHGCPNCGGQVTVKALSGRNIKMANTTVYTHVCTTCGQNSAYTCAAHSKG
jgi:hypothetical protein